MTEIEKILKLDKEVSQIFEEYSGYLISTKIIQDFPNTIKLLQNFDISSNSIKDWIFNCIKNENLFSVNVLFRSQIEHFIKFHYIFLKFFEEENDSQAKEYINYYYAEEELERLKAIDISKHIKNSTYKKKTTIELMKWSDVFHNFTKESNLTNTTRKFRYKNILLYIRNLCDRNGTEVSPFFKEIVILYSKLSSYVHWWIYSSQEMNKFQDKDYRSFYALQRCKLSCQMSIHKKISILDIICINSKDKKVFNPYLIKLTYQLDQLNKLWNS